MDQSLGTGAQYNYRKQSPVLLRKSRPAPGKELGSHGEDKGAIKDRPFHTARNWIGGETAKGLAHSPIREG